jgi:hypothetical protein
MNTYEHSKRNALYIGILSGLVVVFIITSIIIQANIKEDGLNVWDHYIHFFDSPIARTRVLLSLTGGAIGLLPVFYFFLNKKMMKSVRGVIIILVIAGLMIAWGKFFN